MELSQKPRFSRQLLLLSITKVFIKKSEAKACGFRKVGKLFCLTKKLQKNKNPCRIYRAGHFCYISKLLAPPRVEILHEAKFTRNHGAFSRFAEGLWSAKTNFLPIPPRDPNGFAVCAMRFDSATRRCCFAQDDRGGGFRKRCEFDYNFDISTEITA